MPYLNRAQYGDKCNLNHINTSKITDISILFKDLIFKDLKFNQDTSTWDVSGANNMDSLFEDSQFSFDLSK